MAKLLSQQVAVFILSAVANRARLLAQISRVVNMIKNRSMEGGIKLSLLLIS